MIPNTVSVPPQLKHWLHIGLVAICGVLFVSALVYGVNFHTSTDILPYDDAFITYRYVDNFLAGRGLVYNVPERVLGSTTPLYIFWLILLKSVFRSIELPALAVRVNVVFYISSAVLVSCLFWHRVRHWFLAFCVGSFFAVNSSMLIISSGGMESFLFLSLVLVGHLPRLYPFGRCLVYSTVG